MRHDLYYSIKFDLRLSATLGTVLIYRTVASVELNIDSLGR